jgi:hypothetical protein
MALLRNSTLAGSMKIEVSGSSPATTRKLDAGQPAVDSDGRHDGTDDEEAERSPGQRPSRRRRSC